MDKHFYQGLLDQISDGVYFVTLDRRITYWNGGAERITGYGAHEVLGHSCAEGILRHVDDAGHQLCVQGCPLLAVMKDGRPREARVYLHHKDGHRVPVTVKGQALRDSGGKIVGSVEVFSSRLSNPYSGQRRVQRRASNTGVIMVAGQKVALGRVHKYQTVTVLVSETTLAIELDDEEIRVVRRTTTQPVRSIKGQRPRNAASVS